jgi:hypothetical protein
VKSTVPDDPAEMATFAQKLLKYKTSLPEYCEALKEKVPTLSLLHE